MTKPLRLSQRALGIKLLFYDLEPLGIDHMPPEGAEIVPARHSRPDQNPTVRSLRPLAAEVMRLPCFRKGSRYTLRSVLVVLIAQLFLLFRAECPERLFDATGLGVIHQ